ncbi:MAG: hypothetical protein V5A24_07010 [Haloarculaceae archaeon]
MQLQYSFGVLSEVIAAYEADGGSVRGVETTSEPNGVLQASLDVPVERCVGAESDGAGPASATVTPDGGLRVEYTPAELPNPSPPAEDVVTVTGREATVTADGEIVLSIDLLVEPPDARGGLPDAPSGQDSGSNRGEVSSTTRSGGGTSVEVAGETRDGGAAGASDDAAPPAGDGQKSDERDASPDSLAAARDASIPPFEDVAYLRRLYERCDTFAEMSQRIEMDVSAETVRRYMTDAGVHQPECYGDAETETAKADEKDERGPETALANGKGAEGHPATGGGVPSGAPAADAGASATVDSEAGTEGTGDLPPDEHLVADGLGLPADLDLRDVVDAVVEARCLYDVTRSLDLDQERTRDLLVQLNLLDLVSHRLSAVQEEETSFEDVAARIRQCSPEAT